MEPTCIDLRTWAKAKCYRWRFEESYQAERPENRGDGRWYVEIVCQNGLIYPKGGNMLLAYAKAGVKADIRALGGDIQHHQWDGNGEVFKFPVGRLDEVAAILKPRKRRTVGASPEQLRAMRERRKSLVQRGANQPAAEAIRAKTSEEG